MCLRCYPPAHTFRRGHQALLTRGERVCRCLSHAKMYARALRQLGADLNPVSHEVVPLPTDNSLHLYAYMCKSMAINMSHCPWYVQRAVSVNRFISTVDSRGRYSKAVLVRLACRCVSTGFLLPHWSPALAPSHDLISMTLMKGRDLLACPLGVRGLL